MKSRLAERLGMFGLHGICSLDLGLTHVYGSVTLDGQRRTRDTRKLSFMGSYLGQYAHVIHHATTGCDSFVLYRLNWNIGHNCLRTPVSSQFMHLFVSKTVIPGSFHCGGRSSGPSSSSRAPSYFHSRCTDPIFADMRFTFQGSTASPLIFALPPVNFKGEITQNTFRSTQFKGNCRKTVQAPMTLLNHLSVHGGWQISPLLTSRSLHMYPPLSWPGASQGGCLNLGTAVPW